MKIDVVQIELRKVAEINIEGSAYVYNSYDAKKVFFDQIGKRNVECIGILCLDHTNKIINYSDVAIGTVNEVKANVCQLVKYALLSNCSKVVVAHNHPSGVLSITSSDLKMTKLIGKALSYFGIALLDSIIVNRENEMVSIREHIKELDDE